MSGPTHSTRSPHRLSEAAARDQASYTGRMRVKNAALRKVKYWRPMGKAFHEVTNPYSGTRYVVADGLGGATLEKGSPAMAASYQGQHGETLISRPPAGAGGSSSSETTIPPFWDQPPAAVDPLNDYQQYALAYNEGSESVIIARAVMYDGDPDTYFLELVSVSLGDIPHFHYGVGDVFWEEPIDSLILQPRWMVSFGEFVAFCFTRGEAGTSGGTEKHYAVLVDLSGEEHARVEFDGEQGAQVAGAVVHGDYIYSVEPPTTQSVSGPPFLPDFRIVRRDKETMEIESSYTWPNTSPYDGRSTRAWMVDSIIIDGGFLYVHFSHIREPDLDLKTYYRKFNLDLSVSELTHLTDFWSEGSGGGGSGRLLAIEGGGFLSRINGQIYHVSLDETLGVIFDSFVDDDPSGYGSMATVPGGDVVILGGVLPHYLTSILKLDGTQIIPEEPE